VRFESPESFANIVHTHTTGGPLKFSAVGYNGATGDIAGFHIDAPLGIDISEYFVRNSEIVTTADSIVFANAFVPGDLIIRTPRLDLVIDNSSQVPRDQFDAQLYGLDPRFFLNLNRSSLLTDEFVLFYLPGVLDTQANPVAFDAISIRRNQQL